MTRDEIIALAREAGLVRPNSDWTLERWGEYEITRFANLVAAAENEACLNQVEILVEAEREACARVCEVHGSMAKHAVWMAEECAALIRARGER